MTDVEGFPEHTDSASGVFDTAGFGLTVITCVIGAPPHPLFAGMMVMVTVPAVLVELVSGQAGMGFAVPFAEAPDIPGVETVDHE